MMNYGMYPSYYQPMFNAQQRIQQYEQMMPQVQQPAQQAPQQQAATQILQTIPVSTIEEAKAYIVDAFGTPTLFYNAGKNEIYLKKTNKQTAEAEFFVFTKQEQPLNEVKDEKSINTYEKDFKTLNDKIDGFARKIDGLYSLLQEKPQEIENKGGKNVK
jgi:hypothetical protein|nr:MAG TPA: hypothetical protein [Bacteriophage sp.]